MKVKVKVYDRCKYDPESKKVGDLIYDIVKYRVEVNFDPLETTKYKRKVKSMDRFNCGNFYMIDTDGVYSEVLVLVLSNGETATFYNSYVDLFIL